MRQEPESKILDAYGRPVTKAIDSRQLLGVDLGNFYDVWQKQRKPDRNKLIAEYKSTAYACVNLNVGKVSSIELRLYRKGPAGQKARWPVKSLGKTAQEKVTNGPYCKQRLGNGEQVQEITQHPLLDLLDKPNPYADRYGLLEFTQLFLEICGSSYWYTPLNGLGQPVEIYLLLPQYVKPELDSDGHIVCYRYGKGSHQITYETEEIIPFLMRNPANPWIEGQSPLMAVYDNLNIEDKLTATTAAILDNNGRPDAVLTAKDGIGPDEAQRWEYKFNQKFRKAGSGGVIVLDEDATITPLTFSPRDLSWLAIHDTSRLAICNAFGVPYALLDKGGNSQYNVDVSLRQRHVEDSIIPRLRQNQSILNRHLVSRFDPSGRLFFCYDDASPTNRELRRHDLQLIAQHGAITKNELREEYGFDPEPWGEYTATAGAGMGESLPAASGEVPGDTGGNQADEDSTQPDTNTAPTTAPAAPTAAIAGQDLPDPKNTLAGGQITAGLAIVQAVAGGQLPRDAGIGTLMVLLNLTREQAEAVLGSVGSPSEPTKSCSCSACQPQTKAAKKPLAGKLAKVLKGFFAKQRRQVLASLAKGKGYKALPTSFVPLKSWDKELYADCQPVIELMLTDAYEATGKTLVAQAGASADVFDVTNPNLQKKIDELVLQFCEETNATTTQNLNDALAQLKEELAEGLVSGDRMAELVDRVQAVFDNAEDERATLIAATEASRAENQAALQSYKDSGVVWGTKILPSSGACELCLSIAEEGEVELGDVFYKDENAPAAYQEKDGPPLHPGCECALIAVLAGEE